MIRAMPWLFLWFLALAWLLAWVNREPLRKFWEALRKIITFEPLRRKPAQTMGMLNGRLVPAAHLAIVRKTASQEHEFGLMPHSDPDIIDACLVLDCEQRAELKGLPKRPNGQPPMMIQLSDRGKDADVTTIFGDDVPIVVVGEGVTITAHTITADRIHTVPIEFNPDYDLLEEVRNRT